MSMSHVKNPAYDSEYGILHDFIMKQRKLQGVPPAFIGVDPSREDSDNLFNHLTAINISKLHSPDCTYPYGKCNCGVSNA